MVSTAAQRYAFERVCEGGGTGEFTFTVPASQRLQRFAKHAGSPSAFAEQDGTAATPHAPVPLPSLATVPTSAVATHLDWLWGAGAAATVIGLSSLVSTASLLVGGVAADGDDKDAGQVHSDVGAGDEHNDGGTGAVVEAGGLENFGHTASGAGANVLHAAEDPSAEDSVAGAFLRSLLARLTFGGHDVNSPARNDRRAGAHDALPPHSLLAEGGTPKRVEQRGTTAIAPRASSSMSFFARLDNDVAIAAMLAPLQLSNLRLLTQMDLFRETSCLLGSASSLLLAGGFASDAAPVVVWNLLDCGVSGYKMFLRTRCLRLLRRTAASSSSPSRNATYCDAADEQVEEELEDERNEGSCSSGSNDCSAASSSSPRQRINAGLQDRMTGQPRHFVDHRKGTQRRDNLLQMPVPGAASNAAASASAAATRPLQTPRTSINLLEVEERELRARHRRQQAARKQQRQRKLRHREQREEREGALLRDLYHLDAFLSTSCYGKLREVERAAFVHEAIAVLLAVRSVLVSPAAAGGAAAVLSGGFLTWNLKARAAVFAATWVYHALRAVDGDSCAAILDRLCPLASGGGGEGEPLSVPTSLRGPTCPLETSEQEVDGSSGLWGEHGLCGRTGIFQFFPEGGEQWRSRRHVGVVPGPVSLVRHLLQIVSRQRGFLNGAGTREALRLEREAARKKLRQLEGERQHERKKFRELSDRLTEMESSSSSSFSDGEEVLEGELVVVERFHAPHDGHGVTRRNRTHSNLASARRQADEGSSERPWGFGDGDGTRERGRFSSYSASKSPALAREEVWEDEEEAVSERSYDPLDAFYNNEARARASPAAAAAHVEYENEFSIATPIALRSPMDDGQGHDTGISIGIGEQQGVPSRGILGWDVGGEAGHAVVLPLDEDGGRLEEVENGGINGSDGGRQEQWQ